MFLHGIGYIGDDPGHGVDPCAVKGYRGCLPIIAKPAVHQALSAGRARDGGLGSAPLVRYDVRVEPRSL